ncbi:MAG: response regulator [Acidobacteria bacterium]|nr:response regulator [Acidobacteriota bacterium]
MVVRFISSYTNPPPGFSFCQPKKQDLLRGTVVLLTTDDIKNSGLIESLKQRMIGIIISLGNTPDSVQWGPNLWSLTVEPHMVDHLHKVLQGFAESLESAAIQHSDRYGLEKEVTRLKVLLATTRKHYNKVTENLSNHVSQISELNSSLQDQLARVQAAEKALARSEENLSITLNSIGDGLITVDHDGRIQLMNPVAAQWSGAPAKEAIGKKLSEVFQFFDGKTWTNDRNTESLPKSFLLAGKDGKTRKVAVTASPLSHQSANPDGQVLILRDMTELLALEEQLRQKQRMDAIGQLAGGVAHDFNNILNGILGFAELLQIQLHGRDPESHYVQSILTAVERAAGLTHQLLAFARKKVSEKVSINLHTLIQDTVELAVHTFDRRIHLHSHLDAQFANTRAEPSLIHTVFLNLLINARDAMPEGGHIRVRTQNVHFDSTTFQNLQAGQYIHVQIEDTGQGIEPEHIDKIFEPFFTTKPPDKGTGLGLSAVYGIMHDHQGLIRVESMLGTGTVFHLYFPMSLDEEPMDAKSKRSNIAQHRILVVDDEAPIREYLRIGLGRFGYQVILAHNGLHALEQLEQDAHFDWVVMDLNMPEMSGHETIRVIKQRYPQLRVIIASGYLQDWELRELQHLGANSVLQKPFRIETLMQHFQHHAND